MLPNFVWEYIIISQSVLLRNWILVFTTKLTAKFQNVMNVCPDHTIWIAVPFTNKLVMVMHHFEPDYLQKRLICCLHGQVVCCLQGQGHSEGSDFKNMTFWYIFWTADPFATKFGLLVHHLWLDCLVKRLDCSVAVKLKVAEKVQNCSECSSGRYLLNCWTFCNRTCYDDASSWARVSGKKIGLLSSGSGLQWGLV